MGLSHQAPLKRLLSFVPLLALLVLVALCFAPGLNGPFLFDDYPNLVDNDWLTPDGSSPTDLRSGVLSSESSALSRPLTMATFVLQSLVFDGIHPLSSKVINLGLHLVNGTLLFFLAQALVNAPLFRLESKAGLQTLFPFLAVGIWCLSPLQVSTVLYPVQRMAQLSALFSLASLLVYLRFRLRWCNEAPDADALAGCLCWLLLLTAAGVLAKENAVLIPWLLLLLEYVFFRGQWAGKQHPRIRLLTSIVFLSSFLFCLLVIYAGIDWINAGYGMRSFTLPERLMTEARILWQYVVWFVFPKASSLAMFHDDIPLSTSFFAPATTGFAVIAWAVVIIVGWMLRNKVPELIFGALFFLIGHSLESTVLALELVFEHRNYLPTVGLSIMFAALAFRFARRLRSLGIAVGLAWAPAGLLIVALVVATGLRASTWASEIKLARTEVAYHPNSPRSGYAYANALLRASASPGDTNLSQADYLALARHEFELVSRRGVDRIPGLVMMYVIDEQLYPTVAAGSDAFGAIEDSLDDSRLSASDFTAISALVECYEAGNCNVERQRMLELLDRFEAGFWRDAAVARLRLRILAPKSLEPSARLTAIEELVAAYPDDVQFQYLLLEAYLLAGDSAAAQKSAVRLMALDPRRRQFPVLRDLLRRAAT